MYTADLDGVCILDAAHEILLADPVLQLADNEAGSFTFTIHRNNPGYKSVSLMTSVVTVKWDDEILFKGRVINIGKSFDKSLSVECEGELAYLADSIQRPAEYHDQTVYAYLANLVQLHNGQVGSEKQFEMGSVTVTDSNDSLYRYTNWEDTLEVIKTDLLDSLGGHLRVRYSGTHRYLDYLAEYPRLSGQKIEFGQNLLSYTEETTAMDLATVCIPLGARQEESEIEALEERLTIESVNNNKDYLELAAAISAYGRITKTVIWDNVHTPSILKSKGRKWLQDNQYSDLELTLTAVDLADFGVDTDHLRLLDRIHCTSGPHGMDHEFPLTSLSINLLDPTQNIYTLGSKAKSFSRSTNRSQVSIQKQLDNSLSKSNVLKQALDNATQLITMVGKDGHVIFSPSVSEPNELYITDYDNLEDAQRCWRWNLNGLGYSSSGVDGPFDLAITMDGTIAGKFIAAGTIGADQINVSYTSQQEKKWQDELGNNYWTSAVVQTKIKNSADAITLEVNEKVGANEIINAINLSTEGIKIDATKFDITAETVRMRWNQSSRYMEFVDGGLSIFESATSHANATKLMRMDENGMTYWRDGYSIGHIGANHFKNRPENRGLDFDLDYNGSYMTWGYQHSSGADYTVKLTYASKAFGTFGSDHFYFGAPVDFSYLVAFGEKTTFADVATFNNNVKFNYYATFDDGLKISSDNWIECTSTSGTIYIRNPMPYSSTAGTYGANYTSAKIPASFNSDGSIAQYYNARVIGGIIYHVG